MCQEMYYVIEDSVLLGYDAVSLNNLEPSVLRQCSVPLSAEMSQKKALFLGHVNPQR